MANDNDTDTPNGKVTAPYVGFPTFKNMLSGFKQHALPDRIDRSVLGNFSGIVGGQLLGTLRFFDLIDQAGHPKPALRKLVDSVGSEEWAALLAQHIRQAYAPLLALKLESASPAQFQETFRRSYSGEGDTSRKSVSFFLNAATEAKIPVSSYLLKNKKPRNGAVKRKAKATIPAAEPKASADAATKTEQHRQPQNHVHTNAPKDLASQLLDKFPSLDPEWPDAIKTKWFEGYERLLSMGDKK